MSSGSIINGIITSPARLDKALADATELSRARVQALISDGAVKIDGALADSPSAKVQAGAPFQIILPPALELEAQPQDIPLEIAFEDEHLVIVNKPAGMVVHPAAGNRD
ncbi:MAG: S4 domain-containing protein, partial [Pseudomonadota bacterium]